MNLPLKQNSIFFLQIETGIKSYNHAKIVATSDAVYYTYSQCLSLKSKMGHDMVQKKAGFPLLSYPFPPHQSMVGALVRLLTTWLGSTLHRGERAHFFSQKSTKYVNLFIHMIGAQIFLITLVWALQPNTMILVWGKNKNKTKQNNNYTLFLTYS